MWLFGRELAESIYPDAQRDEVIQLAQRDSWGEIDRIGVFPHEGVPQDETVIDLTVGRQIYVHAEDRIVDLEREENRAYLVEPGESVGVLTTQYLVVPRDVGGILLAKAGFTWEGVGLSTTKIDPTWYGCLQVTLSNNTRDRMRLQRGDPFCSAMFFRLPKPVDRTLKGKPHLGQTELRPGKKRARSVARRSPDQVPKDEFARCIERNGPPLDVVRAELARLERTILERVNEEIVPRLRSDVKNDVKGDVEREFKEHYKGASDRTHGRWTTWGPAIAAVLIVALWELVKRFGFGWTD